MKVGDLVKKKAGNLDQDKIGVILEIVTNDVGTTIVTVTSENKIKNWYSEFLEVVDSLDSEIEALAMSFADGI